MKFYFILYAIVVLAMFSACNKTKEENYDAEKYKVELNSYATEYMMGLKSVLVKNMQQGGPLQAINVCSDTAAIMTENYSAKNNILVKRTSFKNRNKENYPDAFEERAINYFNDQIKNNNVEPGLSLIEKMNIDNQEVVKFAKPIFIEAPCLNCHGSKEQISSEVAEFLKNKYPNDKATSYAIGDLRGVISVTKIL